jgi:hypothetical protein
MYRGFKLSRFGIPNVETRENLISLGDEIYKEDTVQIEEDLRSFIFSDNSLDGTKIQNAWFPQIDAEVFISHSHADKEMAMMLAGWLKENFKIRSFIDSCIWGYANDLLKMIDNQYCRNKEENSYNYHKRNYSTSHVHMMLSSALSMMIDKTECLIFLDTPESIKPHEGIEKTESPWLYFEIGVSQIIRKRIPERRHSEYEKLFSKGEILEKAGLAKYIVDLSHLAEIDHRILNLWSETKNIYSAQDALDALYKIKPQKRYSDSLHE